MGRRLLPFKEDGMASDPYAVLGPALLVERRGPIRLLTLNGPERLNSVDDALHRSLNDVWDLLADDDDAGAAVLTGAGRAFCAGGYFPNFVRSHENVTARRRDLRNAERLARSMIDCDVPVVAAVNGPAIGLGASLATLCDIVVMASDAYIADPHVNVGVVAGDGGAVSWPLLMSLLSAKEHLLLGNRIPADECRRLGLANHVVPSAEVVSTSLSIAERLAAQPRQAVRDTKRALNQHLQQAATNALSFAVATERECFASPEVLDTVARLRAGESTTA